MLIVLEGCDGSGKTTLANKLAAILDAEIIHCTTDTPNDYSFFSQIIGMAEEHNIIADRFCYGQFVYQEPEERRLDSVDLYHLELYMMKSNAKVVFVDCNEDTLSKRLNSREEIPMRPIPELQRRYAEVFANSLLSIIVADTGKLDKAHPGIELHPLWKEGIKDGRV